ncbi:NAD(P)/FAD-dependent oxidoreductase [Solicola sp. PLA-1-18]|uniref:NAD(P)/FAD-dependent oxidoreductase n=1 Tax=Solicola sp. PLA-1-18 TaxID=3380532 RepID=UPI003B765A22
MDETYDVVVIGGGAAGLSGAVALARSRRSVLVVDAGSPRNAPADGVHNYLGREGTSPTELVAIGRTEAEGYGAHVVDGEVTSASRTDGGFGLGLADGRSVRARRLLGATGLVDELPDLPGLAEGWGSDVLHCPYCHGYEVRDQAVGVLSTGPMTSHKALMFRQLSDDVVLLQHTGPALTGEEREQLAARGVRVVEGEVAAVERTDGRLTGVRLVSGEVVPMQALVVAPRFLARPGPLADLGVTTSDLEVAGHVIGSQVVADPMGATEVPGVWVAGNVANAMAQVVVAAGQGLMAGAAINGDLIAEDARAATMAS